MFCFVLVLYFFLIIFSFTKTENNKKKYKNRGSYVLPGLTWTTTIIEFFLDDSPRDSQLLETSFQQKKKKKNLETSYQRVKKNNINNNSWAHFMKVIHTIDLTTYLKNVKWLRHQNHLSSHPLLWPPISQFI